MAPADEASSRRRVLLGPPPPPHGSNASSTPSGSLLAGSASASPGASQALMRLSTSSASGTPVSVEVAHATNGTDGSGTQTEGANVVAGDDTVVEENDDHDELHPAKKHKKCTSDVWEYFTKYTKTVEINGKLVEEKWAKCNFKGCRAPSGNNRCESNRGTTGFWNHLSKYHSVDKKQLQLKTGKDAAKDITFVEPFRYDQEVSLRKFYLAIIMHEYPFNIAEHEYFVDFIKSLRPNFPIKSRVTVRKEILGIYLEEKNKLYECLKFVKSRICATMDMWTSNQNKGYMCVTLHWIDDNWRIQKRIANFIHVEGRHTGVKLSETFTTCLLNWFVEKKMFSLSLDNASANEVAVKDVICELKKHGPLLCDGLFFHARCANQIMNLIAKDGLQEIATTIQNIRLFVISVKNSTVQWEEFLKCASECELDTTRGLSTDCCTRWNATYMMLRDALYYKKAFQRLTSKERRKYESICPLPEQWEKASKVCMCLKKFSDLTNLFSGILYPTANLFYRGFCKIKLLLTSWSRGNDTMVKNMAASMNTKFDKYWKKSNTALAVASFLDPRFKTIIVHFYMKKFYGDLLQVKFDEFLSTIMTMYDFYVAAAPPPNSNAPQSSNEPAVEEDANDFDSELDKYLYKKQTNQSQIVGNDLEKYLAGEPLLLDKASENTFDILLWWKDNADVYPVLSLLARDVLAMQVSTVASEYAFSAGGRVIDPYRSRLDPEIVEALICTKDWIAAARKGEKKIKSFIFFACRCNRLELPC
jgi:hypothetical protein